MEMIKEQSTKSNFIFQVIYQILIWVAPLVISPYLTRHLGSEPLGTYTYVNSIAYYFLIFANLGIAKYGQRAIAEVKNDSIELRKCFWSLYINHFITAVISLVFYMFFVMWFVQEDRSIYYISGLYVLSALFDISWLFYGLENFKSVAIKNAVVKIIDMLCIFMFVKEPSDLWKYTLISCVSTLFSQIVLIPQAVKNIKIIKVSLTDIFKHTKPLLLLFISVIAITLYTIFDKTLLGILSTKENVAYYEYANRIINIPKQFIGIISTILFPKICFLVNNNRIKESRKYLSVSVTITSMLAFASIFGIISVADEFALIYYGKSFAETGKIMACMSPLIYILTLGDTIRLQYMIPNHKDRAYITCACCNALLNLILSTLLIPKWGVYGAITGTMGAEIFGLLFQIIYSRKFVPIKLIIGKGIPFFSIGLIMFIALKLLDNVIFGVSVSLLIIKIIIGVFVYISNVMIYVLYISKDRLLYRDFIRNKIKL